MKDQNDLDMLRGDTENGSIAIDGSGFVVCDPMTRVIAYPAMIE